MKNIELSRQEQFKEYEKKCKNKNLTEDFIKSYGKSTKNAIESILNMGEAVYGIYCQVKNYELNSSDLGYFCMKVGLDQKSSTFRKYKAIGENAKKFRQYMNKMPGTFSVLYEIATLDADQFEKLMKNAFFSNHLTLEEVKKLVANPQRKNLSQNNATKAPASRLQTTVLSRYVEGVNSFSIRIAADLDSETFKSIIETLVHFRNNEWIKFDFPKVLQSRCGTTRKDRANNDDDLRFFSAIMVDDAA